ncbi:VOC family protein [Planomicrobium okeanokoites]|uniref:VOC family protein n=1 Tax=Planomicrobium okeanokoites TaxID=244 RepID=UPI0035628180
MEFSIGKIDHIQVAAPKGGEAEAIAFYSGVLGMKEIEKPEPLKARGGVWFGFDEFQLHVGIEEPFNPAKKAHPAFKVSGYDSLRSYLEEKNITVTVDDSIPGVKRFFAADPFGNRLEFLK